MWYDKVFIPHLQFIVPLYNITNIYRAWENIGGLKHWRMANLNQLANGLTRFQCKGVTEIIGEKN